ncbi:REP-associated tyrosine transposase [Pseudomonas monteilii]|uniref:REP-associated tyrosine transposase n=1 Tax=Pseudomonas monteilii TaxID=76759 RepID=UPI0037F68659
MPNPHGCLLRRGRCSEPGRLYMLTSVTYHRRPLFQNFQFARLVIHHLRRADQEQHCRSLARVVMPDHVHWLLELKDVTLGTLMQRFKSRTSHALRKAGSRAAPIWQAGYHDRALRHDEEVVEVARYIIANPIRAGLVDKVGDYPHWDAVWL